MDGKNTAGGNIPTAHRGGENVNGMAGTEMGEVVRMTVQRGEGAEGIGRGRGAQLCAGDRDRGTEKEIEGRQTGGRVENELEGREGRMGRWNKRGHLSLYYIRTVRYQNGRMGKYIMSNMVDMMRCEVKCTTGGRMWRK